jgi:hypothetical protein
VAKSAARKMLGKSLVFIMGSGFVVFGWKVSGYPVDLRFTFCAPVMKQASLLGARNEN